MKTLIIGKRKALSNWVRQFTTFIDVEKRYYKLEEGLFGIFKWGEFKPLPKIDYVLVFRSFFAKCEQCSLEDSGNPNAYFQVSLVYNKNRKIILQDTKNKQEALNLAYEVASSLNTKLKDSASTTGEVAWLL
ncbi:MAG: hypothetical protein HY062_05805 [Bacteroidetes bacterium]|nr:hypothetical protein [Bacteroidota bacterium]